MPGWFITPEAVIVLVLTGVSRPDNLFYLSSHHRSNGGFSANYKHPNLFTTVKGSSSLSQFIAIVSVT